MAEKNAQNAKANFSLVALEGWLEKYFVKKAPWQIPGNGREVIVKLIPWLNLILLILLLPALLVIFSLGSAIGVLAPSVGVAVGPLYYLALLVLLAQAVMMAIALPGLFKRKRTAWLLIYYATLISAVYALVDWIARPIAVFGFIWSLVATAISLYILFQVRSYYKN